MWPYVIGAVAILLLLFVVVVATRPDVFKVERSAGVAAPAEAIFAQVNDFHRWNDWSPWAKLDPTMKQTFEGAASGVGAVQTWEGKKSGKGRSTIVASVPPSRVEVKLEFMKPWVATNMAAFHIEPQGGGTRVTWTMTGRKNFMMKGFTMFCNMDKMIGQVVEKGLAGLRAIAESRREAIPAGA